MDDNTRFDRTTNYRSPSLSALFVLISIRKRPLSAYLIKKRVFEQSLGAVIVQEATIISLLRRLHRDGLVSATKEWFGSGRELTAYQLTGSGVQLLERELRTIRALLRAAG